MCDENYKGYGLVPYSDGNFPDEFLIYLFERMQEEGTASVVFFEGKITTSEKWLEMIKCHGMHLFVGFFDGELAGLCWLERSQEKWAQFNFCFFKNSWGHKKSIAWGKWAANELLNLKDEHGYLMDMLVGITPSRNKLALRLAKLCDWKESGRLPFGVFNGQTGKSEEAVISTFIRGDCL
ncbi:hypothetical protein [Maridesulfovibrio ferrireducens]|uniref:hypothetical protein n=1 Tax=Maridesulfovibrio ferrireducens TaxID=246191 RepID=UPI001A312B64|nr:hypothetical protein [Maridesulfovibrio ferrireducens]MBI9113146.1 hypothetical protein [Maridesulfovibrio ferrireducens]